jgi:L-fucose isomerase-like protein
MTTFGYLEIASPLHDGATVARITATLRRRLDEIGGRPVTAPEERTVEPLVILVATGGTEALVLDALRRRHDRVPFEPALLAAHPLHNSLPAALETLARVHADGGRGRIVQLGPGSPTRLARAIADVVVVHRMHRTRLGIVGEPSPWLVASVPDSELVRTRWGIEMVPIDISSTIEGHHHADADRTRAVAVHFAGTAPPTPALVEAAKLHPSLVDAIESADVDAVTVRCFDYLDELQTSGCVALAQLNDTGVVAGCEGDVASAVAMLLVRALLDQPSWMANPAWIDVDHDRIVLAHCTIAPSLVEHVTLHTHFESGLGVGLRGRFADGPVTLIRLGGSALERCWVAEGHAEHINEVDDLCRTQVAIQLTGASVEELLDAPLGNHLVLVRGHHRERIEQWWRSTFSTQAPAA